MDSEAQLFACCCNVKDSIVITGDFKALRCLAEQAPQAIRGKLYGRVRSTEQCVLGIIEHKGFDHVSECLDDGDCEHYVFGQLEGKKKHEAEMILKKRLTLMSAGKFHDAGDSIRQEAKKLLGWHP